MEVAEKVLQGTSDSVSELGLYLDDLEVATSGIPMFHSLKCPWTSLTFQCVLNMLVLNH